MSTPLGMRRNLNRQTIPPASLAFYLPLESDPKPLVLVRRYNTVLQITLDDQVAPDQPHAMLRIPVSRRADLLVDYSDQIAPQELEPHFIELQRHLFLRESNISASLGPLACARATWLMRTRALSAEAAIAESARLSEMLLAQEQLRLQDVARLYQWGQGPAVG